jgi:hypothetical protein
LVTLIEWATIATAVAGISATAFILLQLRHMEKHRNLEISMTLFEWAESDRLRKAFRWIEQEFQFEDYEKYKAQERNDIGASDYPYEVAAFFEQVGFLVDRKFVDLDFRRTLSETLPKNYSAHEKNLETDPLVLIKGEHSSQ